MYWADAKLDMLVSYDLKIKKKTVLLNSNVLHPFGLAVFQDHLYWTGSVFLIAYTLLTNNIRA